ncbi:hypothetical protein GGF43_002982 [Coemansia sp. RSA 2618]|nr:hypothetical protein GGF43_002982 [Coemansia sp. RSA 2618]
MFKRTASLLTIAALAIASPLQVRDNVPSNIATVLGQVADIIGNGAYASVVFNAAANMADVDGQPEQSAADAQIMTSLFEVLKTQGNSKDAVSIATSVALLLENAYAPTEIAGALSTLISQLKDAKADTNVASNVNYMINFVENAMSIMPSAFDNFQIGETEPLDGHGDNTASTDSPTDSEDDSSDSHSKDKSSSGEKSDESESSAASGLTISMFAMAMGAMSMLF